MSSLTLIRGLCLRQKLLGNNEQPPHSRPSTSLQLKCSPSQHIVAPCCPEGSSLWARDGQSRTSEVHLKEGVKKKIPISALRMKYLPKNTMQRLLLYSGHSINQPWNKSWRDIQRATAKKRKGSYSNFQRREKVIFSLLLLVPPVAKINLKIPHIIVFLFTRRSTKGVKYWSTLNFDPVALKDCVWAFIESTMNRSRFLLQSTFFNAINRFIRVSCFKKV